MPQNRPWEDVKEDSYFRGILKNIHHTGGLGLRAEIRVRFGLKGHGVNPHYQLEGSNGEIRRFSGQSHKPYHRSPNETFEPGNISDESFSVEDIKSMLARCLSPR